MNKSLKQILHRNLLFFESYDKMDLDKMNTLLGFLVKKYPEEEIGLASIGVETSEVPGYPIEYSIIHDKNIKEYYYVLTDKELIRMNDAYKDYFGWDMSIKSIKYYKVGKYKIIN